MLTRNRRPTPPGEILRYGPGNGINHRAPLTLQGYQGVRGQVAVDLFRQPFDMFVPQSHTSTVQTKKARLPAGPEGWKLFQ